MIRKSQIASEEEINETIGIIQEKHHALLDA